MFKLSNENFLSQYIDNFSYFSYKCVQSCVGTNASTRTFTLRHELWSNFFYKLLRKKGDKVSLKKKFITYIPLFFSKLYNENLIFINLFQLYLKFRFLFLNVTVKYFKLVFFFKLNVNIYLKE